MVCCLFNQKTAYEVRISDWISDVCSSDLHVFDGAAIRRAAEGLAGAGRTRTRATIFTGIRQIREAELQTLAHLRTEITVRGGVDVDVLLVVLDSTKPHHIGTAAEEVARGTSHRGRVARDGARGDRQGDR